MEKHRSASVPHIKFEIPKKPLQHFSLSTTVVQCGWRRSGRFALWFGVLISVAVLGPYTLALWRGHVQPLLPFISKSGGIPPESGVFSIILYMTALVGTIMIVVRYVYVSSQNLDKDWRANILNKIGFLSGFLSFIGMVVVAAYPVNLWNSKEDWKTSVLIPHITGAFCLFFFGAVYLLFQTAISLFFYEGRKGIVILRFVLFLLCAVSFIASTVSHIATMDSMHPKGILIETDLNTAQNEYSEQYLISSICEWAMVFLFVLYFFTFFWESQKVSVAITFRTLSRRRNISLASLGNINKI